MESKLFAELAGQYSMTTEEFISAVKMQCFKDGAASNAQLLILLSIARQYGLNPLVRELHAFVDPSGKMQVIVGVDGWFKILSRDPRVAGWEEQEERDKEGNLVAVTVSVYRKDRVLADGRQLPVVYRAVMAEWLVEHKAGKGETNWEEMSEHRLHGVALKEAARRCLGITEAMGDADEAKMVAAAPVREAAVTPVAEQPKALEHQPLEVLEPAEPREKVPAAAGHLRVELDKVQVTTDGKAAEEPKRRGRPRKEEQRGVAEERTQEVAPPEGSSEPIQASADKSSPQSGASPNPPTDLETFVRAHDVPEKRVNLFCAKKGVGSLAELDDGGRAELLGILQKSYS